MSACWQSPEWRQYLETGLLPWVMGRAELGDDVLEVGPDPGLTTDRPPRAGPTTDRWPRTPGARP